MLKSTNCWERMRIKHLSPSAINAYIEGGPGNFVYKYIAKIYDNGNPKMWLGSAVEKGGHELLLKRPFDKALQTAIRSFDVEVVEKLGSIMLSTEEVTSERKRIEPMLAQFHAWMATRAPKFTFLGTQKKVSWQWDELPIPIIGFVDFAWDIPLDIDCKTTSRTVNGISAGHARQVSIYSEAQGGTPQSVLYIMEKKHLYFDLSEDQKRIALESVREAVFALNRFLSQCDTREDAVLATTIDWDHWIAPERRMTRQEIVDHMRSVERNL